jgi:hypothetical protein
MPVAERGEQHFLKQAHRNNWQKYLAALQKQRASNWDICVLTASDEPQATIYRQQLAWRREAGLLGEHWRLNKRMDPGCTNPFIDRLFEALEPYICGGFAFVITKDRQAAAELKAMLNKAYRHTGVELWACQVPESALVSELS